MLSWLKKQLLFFATADSYTYTQKIVFTAFYTADSFFLLFLLMRSYTIFAFFVIGCTFFILLAIKNEGGIKIAIKDKQQLFWNIFESATKNNFLSRFFHKNKINKNQSYIALLWDKRN